MSPYACFLLTFTDGRELFRVAVEVDVDDLGAEVWEYWAEPESAAMIRSYLSSHVRHLGSLVEVRRIFEVVSAKEVKW